MIRILLNGCSGRMGRQVAAAAAAHPDFDIAAGVDVFLDGDYCFPVFNQISQVDVAADVVLDFSSPAGLAGVLDYAVAHSIGVVVATTGLDDSHAALLGTAARNIPILRAANLSLGVNLMAEMTETAAHFLGDDYDIEITETHHTQKRDAPSGTALVLAEAARRGAKSAKQFCYGRHGTNALRAPAEIGLHALRGGNVVGSHTVYFFGHDETLAIEHTATARALFARGALRAAAFTAAIGPGMYGMRDMILASEIVTSLTVDAEQALCTVRQLPADYAAVAHVFDAVAHINLDMIGQSHDAQGRYEVSFTCHRSDIDAAHAALQEAGATVNIVQSATKLTLAGRGMPQYAGIAAKAFHALAVAGIPVLAVTTSETKISCLIPDANVTAAAGALRQTFLLMD